jgi:glycosyltransferase involved in cell wall biosynthesis
MADRLDTNPDAGVCFGDYAEFRTRELVRGVPDQLDPYRLAYTNEYPASSLFRRTALADAGGWRRLTGTLDARSDWNLWLSVAERGARGIHLGKGSLSYVHRVHGDGLAMAGRRRHGLLYEQLRESHPALIADVEDHRQRSSLGLIRRLLYPMVYGRRRRWSGEPKVKALLDRLGIWTLTRPLGEAERHQVLTALAAGHRPHARPTGNGDARIAVLIPCFNDGELVRQAVHSIEEAEPVEVVVVDDGSTDGATLSAFETLEAEGHRVVHLGQNQGVSEARMAGLRATRAPYVFPLDADDMAVPGALALMADRLDSEPDAAVCFGDYAELQIEELLRAVPDELDPYRLAFTNEYPGTSLYRRSLLESLGGWRFQDAFEDWDLWMSIVDHGAGGMHFGPGAVTFKRKVHPDRMGASAKPRYRAIYRALRERHPKLFAQLREYRRRSAMNPLRKWLYPVVYGGRPRLRGEPLIKSALDRLGIWTLRR